MTKKESGTIREVAKATGVSKITLYRWVKLGKLEPISLDPLVILVRDVARLLNKVVKCKGCGMEFDQGQHNQLYCIRCQRMRNSQSHRRAVHAYNKRQAEKGGVGNV